MAEPAPKRLKTDAMAAVRVAVRAAERAEWIGHVFEIKYLKEQADSIRHEAPVDKEAELELIIQQLQQKAARDRQKAAHDSETFTCTVCMDKKPMGNLRVNTPCGHGFCKACIDDAWHKHGAPAAPDCFTCRTTVVSVMKVYF